MGRIASQGRAANPGDTIAVGMTSTPVASYRPDRQELILSNDSDTTIYVQLAGRGAEVGKGVRLSPGGSPFVTRSYHGPVCAVHAGLTGTKNLCVAEV